MLSLSTLAVLMMFQILQRRPTWVFAVFAALLAFGLMQTRTRHVTRVRATILPAVLIVLSSFSVWSTSPARPSRSRDGEPASRPRSRSTSCCNGRVAYMPERHAFLVEGSWLPLAAMMAIFFARYSTNGAFVARALRMLSASHAT